MYLIQEVKLPDIGGYLNSGTSIFYLDDSKVASYYSTNVNKLVFIFDTKEHLIYDNDDEDGELELDTIFSKYLLANIVNVLDTMVAADNSVDIQTIDLISCNFEHHELLKTTLNELKDGLSGVTADNYINQNCVIRYSLDENASRHDYQCVLKYSTDGSETTRLTYDEGNVTNDHFVFWNEYLNNGYKLPGSNNRDYSIVQSSRYLYGNGNLKSLIHSQLMNIADKIRYDKYDVGNTDVFANCNYAKVDGEDVLFLAPFKSPYFHIIRPHVINDDNTMDWQTYKINHRSILNISQTLTGADEIKNYYLTAIEDHNNAHLVTGMDLENGVFNDFDIDEDTLEDIYNGYIADAGNDTKVALFNYLRFPCLNKTFENFFTNTSLLKILVDGSLSFSMKKIYNEYCSNIIYSNHSLWLLPTRSDQHDNLGVSNGFFINTLPYSLQSNSHATDLDNGGIGPMINKLPKTFVISGFPELKRFGLKVGDNIINVNGRYCEMLNFDIPKMIYRNDTTWDSVNYVEIHRDDSLNYFNDDKYHPDSYDFSDDLNLNTLTLEQQETMKKKIGIRTTNVFYMDVKKPGTQIGETMRIYLLRRIKYRPFQTLRYPSLTYPDTGANFKMAHFYEGGATINPDDGTIYPLYNYKTNTDTINSFYTPAVQQINPDLTLSLYKNTVTVAEGMTQVDIDNWISLGYNDSLPFVAAEFNTLHSTTPNLDNMFYHNILQTNIAYRPYSVFWTFTTEFDFKSDVNNKNIDTARIPLSAKFKKYDNETIINDNAFAYIFMDMSTKVTYGLDDDENELGIEINPNITNIKNELESGHYYFKHDGGEQYTKDTNPPSDYDDNFLINRWEEFFFDRYRYLYRNNLNFNNNRSMLEMVNHISIEGLIHEQMDISNNLPGFIADKSSIKEDKYDDDEIKINYIDKGIAKYITSITIGDKTYTIDDEGTARYIDVNGTEEIYESDGYFADRVGHDVSYNYTNTANLIGDSVKMFNHANYTDKLILNELRVYNAERSAFDTVNSLTLNEFTDKPTKVFCRLNGYFRCTRSNSNQFSLYKLKLHGDGEIDVLNVDIDDLATIDKKYFEDVGDNDTPFDPTNLTDTIYNRKVTKIDDSGVDAFNILVDIDNEDYYRRNITEDDEILHYGIIDNRRSMDSLIEILKANSQLTEANKFFNSDPDDILHQHQYKFLKNRVYAIPGNPTYATIYEFNDEYDTNDKNSDSTRSNDYMKVYYDFPAHSTLTNPLNNVSGPIYTSWTDISDNINPSGTPEENKYKSFCGTCFFTSESHVVTYIPYRSTQIVFQIRSVHLKNDPLFESLGQGDDQYKLGDTIYKYIDLNDIAPDTNAGNKYKCAENLQVLNGDGDLWDITYAIPDEHKQILKIKKKIGTLVDGVLNYVNYYTDNNEDGTENTIPNDTTITYINLPEDLMDISGNAEKWTTCVVDVKNQQIVATPKKAGKILIISVDNSGNEVVETREIRNHHRPEIGVYDSETDIGSAYIHTDISNNWSCSEIDSSGNIYALPSDGKFALITTAVPPDANFTDISNVYHPLGTEKHIYDLIDKDNSGNAYKPTVENYSYSSSHAVFIDKRGHLRLIADNKYNELGVRYDPIPLDQQIAYPFLIHELKDYSFEMVSTAYQKTIAICDDGKTHVFGTFSRQNANANEEFNTLYNSQKYTHFANYSAFGYPTYLINIDKGVWPTYEPINAKCCAISNTHFAVLDASKNVYVKYYNDLSNNNVNLHKLTNTNKVDEEGIDISGRAHAIACGDTTTYILCENNKVFAIPIELVNGNNLILDDSRYNNISSIVPIPLNTDAVEGNIITLDVQHDDCIILDEYGKYYRSKLYQNTGALDLSFVNKMGDLDDISNQDATNDYDKGFVSISMDDASMQLITNKDQKLYSVVYDAPVAERIVGPEIAENLIDTYDILPENTVRTPYVVLPHLRDHNYIYQRFKSVDWDTLAADDVMVTSLIKLSSDNAFTHIRSCDVDKIVNYTNPELRMFHNDYDYIEQHFQGTVYIEGVYDKIVIENEIHQNEIEQYGEKSNHFILENEINSIKTPPNNTIDKYEFHITAEPALLPVPILYRIVNDELVDTGVTDIEVYKHDADAGIDSDEYKDFFNHSILSLTTTEADILKKRAFRNKEHQEKLETARFENHFDISLQDNIDTIVEKINDLATQNSIVLGERGEDILYNDFELSAFAGITVVCKDSADTDLPLNTLDANYETDKVVLVSDEQRPGQINMLRMTGWSHDKLTEGDGQNYSLAFDVLGSLEARTHVADLGMTHFDVSMVGLNEDDAILESVGNSLSEGQTNIGLNDFIVQTSPTSEQELEPKIYTISVRYYKPAVGGDEREETQWYLYKRLNLIYLYSQEIKPPANISENTISINDTNQFVSSYMNSMGQIVLQPHALPGRPVTLYSSELLSSGTTIFELINNASDEDRDNVSVDVNYDFLSQYTYYFEFNTSITNLSVYALVTSKDSDKYNNKALSMSSADETFDNINILPKTFIENHIPHNDIDVDGFRVRIHKTVNVNGIKIMEDLVDNIIGSVLTKINTTGLIFPPTVSNGYSAPCYHIFDAIMDVGIIAGVSPMAYIGDNNNTTEVEEKQSMLSFMLFNNTLSPLFDGGEDISQNLLELTFVHEFLHSIQMGSYYFYDRENNTWNDQMSWLMESTAEFVATYDFQNNTYSDSESKIYGVPYRIGFILKLFQKRKYDYFLTTKHYGAFLMIKYFSEKSTLYSAVKDPNGIVDPDVIIDPDDLLFMKTIFELINKTFVGPNSVFVSNYEEPYEDIANNLTITEFVGKAIRRIQDPDADREDKIEIFIKSDIQLFDEYYANFYKTSMVLFAFFELAPKYKTQTIGDGEVGLDLSFTELTNTFTDENSIYVFEEYKNYIDIFDTFDDNGAYELWTNNSGSMVTRLYSDEDKTNGIDSVFLQDVSGNYGADLFIIDTSKILGDDEEGSVTKKTQHISININMLTGSLTYDDDGTNVDLIIPSQQTEEQLANLYDKMDFFVLHAQPNKENLPWTWTWVIEGRQENRNFKVRDVKKDDFVGIIYVNRHNAPIFAQLVMQYTDAVETIEEFEALEIILQKEDVNLNQMIRYVITNNSTFLNGDAIKVTYHQSADFFNGKSRGYFEFKEDVEETVFKNINSVLSPPKVIVTHDVEYENNEIHAQIVIETDPNNRLIHGYKVFWGLNSYLSSNGYNTSEYNQRDGTMTFIVDISGNLSGNFIDDLQIPSHEPGSKFDISIGTRAIDYDGTEKDTIYCSLDASNNIVIRFDRMKMPVGKSHIYVKAVNRQQLVWRPWDTTVDTYDVAEYNRALELEGHLDETGVEVDVTFHPRYLESKIRSVPIVDRIAANVQSARFIYRHHPNTLKNSQVSIAIPIKTRINTLELGVIDIGTDVADYIEEGRIYERSGNNDVVFKTDYGLGGQNTVSYKFYWAKRSIPELDRLHEETQDEWGHVIPPSATHDLNAIHQHTYYYSNQRDYITGIKGNHTHLLYTFGDSGETDGELTIPSDADGLVVEMTYDADGRHHTQTFIPFKVLSAKPLVLDRPQITVNQRIEQAGDENMVDVEATFHIAQNNFKELEATNPVRYVAYLGSLDKTIYIDVDVDNTNGGYKPALLGEVISDDDNEVVVLSFSSIDSNISIDLMKSPYILLMADYGDHLKDEYIAYDMREEFILEFSTSMIFSKIHDENGLTYKKIKYNECILNSTLKIIPGIGKLFYDDITRYAAYWMNEAGDYLVKDDHNKSLAHLSILPEEYTEDQSNEQRIIFKNTIIPTQSNKLKIIPYKSEFITNKLGKTVSVYHIVPPSSIELSIDQMNDDGNVVTFVEDVANKILKSGDQIKITLNFASPIHVQVHGDTDLLNDRVISLTMSNDSVAHLTTSLSDSEQPLTQLSFTMVTKWNDVNTTLPLTIKKLNLEYTSADSSTKSLKVLFYTNDEHGYRYLLPAYWGNISNINLSNYNIHIKNDQIAVDQNGYITLGVITAITARYKLAETKEGEEME